MNQNFSVVFYEIVRYAYKKRQRRSSGKNKVFYTYKGLETEGMAHRKDTRIIRRQKQKPGGFRSLSLLEFPWDMQGEEEYTI